MGILLDTCAWIWLFKDEPRMRRSPCLTAINRAASEDELYVASISAWEVGMLAAKGRISFSHDCLDWVKDSLSQPGVSLAPLHPEIAVLSAKLPGAFHGDPADRILVATARWMDLSLVTAVEKILEYGKKGFVRVIAV